LKRKYFLTKFWQSSLFEFFCKIIVMCVSLNCKMFQLMMMKKLFYNVICCIRTTILSNVRRWIPDIKIYAIREIRSTEYYIYLTFYRRCYRLVNVCIGVNSYMNYHHRVLDRIWGWCATDPVENRGWKPLRFLILYSLLLFVFTPSQVFFETIYRA